MQRRAYHALEGLADLLVRFRVSTRSHGQGLPETTKKAPLTERHSFNFTYHYIATRRIFKTLRRFIHPRSKRRLKLKLATHYSNTNTRFHQ